MKVYTLQRGTGSEAYIKFYKKPANSSISANKAYLPIVSDGGFIKELNAVFEDDLTTGIQSLTNQHSNSNSVGIYDISGRKVINPTKGLYIIDGKKVLVK